MKRRLLSATLLVTLTIALPAAAGKPPPTSLEVTWTAGGPREAWHVRCDRQLDRLLEREQGSSGFQAVPRRHLH